MPPQGTMQNNSQDTGNNKIIVLAIVFILLLVGAFYFLSMKKTPAPVQNTGTTGTEQNNTGLTQEKVEIKKTSLMTGNEANKLPKGYPMDLPVDTTNVTESYVAEYPNRNLTQYTLAFLTTKSVKEEVTMYVSAIEKAGYTFTSDGKNTAGGYLNAKKGKTTVSVNVGTTNGKTIVNITYSVEK